MISNEKINQIINLRNAGYSIRQISKMCGSSQATVKKYTEQNSMNEDEIKGLITWSPS